MYDVTSKGSEAYLNLAREIILKEELQKQEELKNSSLVDQVIFREESTNLNEQQI